MTFVAGTVLTAAALNSELAAKTDLAMVKNAQTGTSYSYALADQTKLLTMSNAAANTVTVTKQATVTWAADTQLRVLNIGAGATTLVADTGVTINNNTALAQWRGGVLIRMSSDVWTFVPFASGVGAANFSDAATGTYTGFKYKTFTASGTLTIPTGGAGFADIVLVGGGGCGAGTGGGGAGGCLVATGVYLPEGTLTVTIGAGGAFSNTTSNNGNASRIGDFYAPGGGGGASNEASNTNGMNGGSGGGGRGTGVGGAGVSAIGNAGGNGASGDIGAGGGGAAAVGANAVGTAGGAGGAGTTTSIAGTTPSGAYVAGSYAFGGGGGGAGSGSAGSGGSGGGGAASVSGVSTAGTANTGGGGGGNWSAVANVGPGGSGILIVRVAV